MYKIKDLRKEEKTKYLYEVKYGEVIEIEDCIYIVASDPKEEEMFLYELNTGVIYKGFSIYDQDAEVKILDVEIIIKNTEL